MCFIIFSYIIQLYIYVFTYICVCVYIYACMLSHFSHVQLFVTPWFVVR